MSSISVIITAYNEEKNIQDCIKSARRISKDIIIIDTQSTDNTAKKAKELGCKVIPFPFQRYVEPSREFAIQSAQGEWVLILDADERISKKLAEEIKIKIESTSITHYYIPRKNIFVGMQWLQHGGWYPDYVLRLIKRSAFKKWPSEIHSTPIILGEKEKLQFNLIHYFHPNLENMVEKTMVYEEIESALLYKAGKHTTTKTFFRKFLGELYRRLFKNKGFLDGDFGVIESMYQAYSKTITYLFLYEKIQRKSSSH